MNRKDLEDAVAMAQQKLQAMELKVLEAERVAKVAKTKAQQLKLKHRRAKKAAKKAKHLAAGIADRATEQCRVLEQAERRLARALAKAVRLRPSARRETFPAAAQRSAPVKSGVAKTPPSRGTAVPLAPRRHSGNGHPRLASLQAPTGVCAQ